MYTICALLYGDHLDLAERCLNSINDSVGLSENVESIMVGLNECSPAVTTFVTDWVERARNHIYETSSISTIHSDINQAKYPMMQWLIFNTNAFAITDNPDSYFMWFDDDSYISEPLDFWEKMNAALEPHIDMYGQPWRLKYQGKQKEWIAQQPWYNPNLPFPAEISFCQGAWWVARTRMLQDLRWPIPALYHCGGDSMLGEVMRNRGYKMKKHDYGVRINADEHGVHSAAKRRGKTERVVGYEGIDNSYQPIHTRNTFMTTLFGKLRRPDNSNQQETDGTNAQSSTNATDTNSQS